MKGNKGITLVALIITIIVLLILAIVTISAVNEGKLFSHANNATTAYDKAAKDENTMISNYITELAKYDKSSNENIFKGKTFRFYGLEDNGTMSSDLIAGNIGDDTLEWTGTTVKYKYDDSTHMLSLYMPDDENFANPVASFNTWILENNIVIQTSANAVITSNGGIGTNGLTGYKYVNEDNDTYEFRVNSTTNVGYITGINDQGNGMPYFLVGNHIFAYMSSGTVNEVNGIYTSVTFDGNEPRNLIPPQ